MPCTKLTRRSLHVARDAAAFTLFSMCGHKATLPCGLTDWILMCLQCVPVAFTSIFRAPHFMNGPPKMFLVQKRAHRRFFTGHRASLGCFALLFLCGSLLLIIRLHQECPCHCGSLSVCLFSNFYFSFQQFIQTFTICFSFLFFLHPSYSCIYISYR